jgi:hypothetical protein
MSRADRKHSITRLRWALEGNGFRGDDREANLAMLSAESRTTFDRSVICDVLETLWQRQKQRDQDSFACGRAFEEMAREALVEKVLDPLITLLKILPKTKVDEALTPLVSSTFRPVETPAPDGNGNAASVTVR